MTIYHKHHIIPRHVGGTDDPSNLKLVTIEEHAEEHKKLYEEHGRWQDLVAWKSLSKELSEEEARIQSVKFALTGVPKSAEHKRKMSEAQRKRFQLNPRPKKIKPPPKPRGGWKHSTEAKLKISLAGKGRPNTTEQKLKISQTRKERGHGRNQPRGFHGRFTK